MSQYSGHFGHLQVNAKNFHHLVLGREFQNDSHIYLRRVGDATGHTKSHAGALRGIR